MRLLLLAGLLTISVHAEELDDITKVPGTVAFVTIKIQKPGSDEKSDPEK